MVSSWIRIWGLIVGISVLIWVSLVSLLLTLTTKQQNIWHMKILLMNYFVFWVNRLLIIIIIQGQPYYHCGDLGEAHHMSLPGHVWYHSSSKHARKKDYVMVGELHIMGNQVKNPPNKYNMDVIYFYVEHPDDGHLH